MFAREQMGAWCGATLIEELADDCSFLPFSTDEDHKREGMVLPCGNPEGDHGKHLLLMTLSSQERDSNEAVEEDTEEMKPSLFSADASSGQHRITKYVQRKIVQDSGCYNTIRSGRSLVRPSLVLSQKRRGAMNVAGLGF
jgi:hypothetical protein